MKNKSIIYGLLVAVTIGGFVYFFQSDEVEESPKVNIVTKKEVKNTFDSRNTKKDLKTEEESKKSSKVEIKAEADNSVVYKNDNSNKDYNMELSVPERWSHLDYSHLGQPKEVALPKEEYLPGDKLYGPDHPDYLKEGKEYVDVETEKAILEFFGDREAIEILLDNQGKFGDRESAEKFFSDINNVISVNEETGRKALGYLSSIHASIDALCFNDAGCADDYTDYTYGKNNAQRILTKDEYKAFIDLVMRKRFSMYNLHEHKNQALKVKKEAGDKRYWCEVRGYCPDGDKNKK